MVVYGLIGLSMFIRDKASLKDKALSELMSMPANVASAIKVPGKIYTPSFQIARMVERLLDMNTNSIKILKTDKQLKDEYSALNKNMLINIDPEQTKNTNFGYFHGDTSRSGAATFTRNAKSFESVGHNFAGVSWKFLNEKIDFLDKTNAVHKSYVLLVLLQMVLSGERAFLAMDMGYNKTTDRMTLNWPMDERTAWQKILISNTLLKPKFAGQGRRLLHTARGKTMDMIPSHKLFDLSDQFFEMYQTLLSDYPNLSVSDLNSLISGTNSALSQFRAS